MALTLLWMAPLFFSRLARSDSCMMADSLVLDPIFEAPSPIPPVSSKGCPSSSARFGETKNGVL